MRILIGLVEERNAASDFFSYPVFARGDTTPDLAVQVTSISRYSMLLSCPLAGTISSNHHLQASEISL